MIFDNATWISTDETVPAPIFRHTFHSSDVTSATIDICGLGFFELYINGERVGDDYFVPAWSDYEPRPGRRMLYPINDTFSHRTYYMEYNVVQYIREGVNAIGVRLGNGWYNQRDRVAEGDFYYDIPKLCFVMKLTHADGTITEEVSNTDMTVSPGEITASNLFYGETHDYRLSQDGFSMPDFDDTGWTAAKTATPPASHFIKQDCPADKVIRRISPTLIFAENDRRIYDCGENITGFVVLRPGTASYDGAVIKVLHAENLTSDKRALDFASTIGCDPNQIQTNTYICAAKPQICRPRFTWQAFRYFEVIGDAEVDTVEVVHGDFPVTSEFSCSDETLNWIYTTYIRTQLGNIHAGVPSDCPHRERLGYTGDGQVTAESAMLTLDCRRLFDKWMEDIIDGQDPISGHVQHTAPFYGGGGGPGGWGGAVWRIPMTYYKMYGDLDFLRKYYPNMKLWLEYMHSRSENGLVVREEKDGWCLGDWCTPEQPELPEPFVNTYYYIKGIRAVLETENLLGIPADPVLVRRLEKTEQALLSYRDSATGSFCGGVNGADAFALDIWPGDERTLAALVKKYSDSGTLDTGIFGTDLLIDVLFREGQPDLAFRLLTSDTPASFAAMKKAGATTLWESWDGAQSHNHPMFGGVVRSFFTHILGIRQAEGTAGFVKTEIRPANISGLKWAKGSIMTPAGRVESAWIRNDD